MLSEIKGDLFKIGANILVHQVNCQGAMDDGIALQIRRNLLSRSQYIEYRWFCEKNDADALGSVLYSRIGSNRYVASCFAQEESSRTWRITDYRALHRCLQNVETTARLEGMSVAIPGYIGCGLEGGDWNVVKAIINNVFAASTVNATIVYYDEHMILGEE